MPSSYEEGFKLRISNGELVIDSEYKTILTQLNSSMAVMFDSQLVVQGVPVRVRARGPEQLVILKKN